MKGLGKSTHINQAWDARNYHDMPVANKILLAHVNPVYAGYFADPFAWQAGNTYYAVGTGSADASGQAMGKVFTVLQSSDFYTWQFAANAMQHPDPAWATTSGRPKWPAMKSSFISTIPSGTETRTTNCGWRKVPVHKGRTATSASR